MKLKPFRPSQAIEPRLLQRHIVIGTEIVEPDHLVAAIEQPGRRMKTDEAGGAGNQNAHGVPAFDPLSWRLMGRAATRAIAASPVNLAGCRPQTPG